MPARCCARAAPRPSQGIGAEQDRYHSHFGLDEQKIQAAASTLMNQRGTGAEQEVHGARFGLGHDGMEQVKKLAGVKGVGAEQVCGDMPFSPGELNLTVSQDRYGSHFGVDENTIAKAKERFHDSIGNNQGVEHMG